MFNQIKLLFKNHLVLVITVLIALFIYSRFLFFGHISWDDPEMVFKNKMVHEFDFKGLITNHFVGNYIPITMLTHALAWALFGISDGGHHTINILIHIVNGILVYQVGKRLFKNDAVANLGAIVFLLHPMQVESVGWISELKNVLSSSFYLFGILSYLNFYSSGKKKDYFLCFLFFVAGCLSKASVIVLPLSLICFDIILQQKLSFKFFLNKIPFLIMSILFGIINLKTQAADLFINHNHEFPYYQRIGFAGFALLKYLILFLFPFNLSVIYPYPANTTPAVIVGLIFILIIVLLLTLAFKKGGYTLGALILFILCNLILVLQFVPFGEVLYADRYLYIPIIGFGWLAGKILSRLHVSALVMSTVLLCVLSFFTFFRSEIWRSGVTLYEDILKNFPNSFVALNSVGAEYMFRNNDEKALYYFNKATNVSPNNYKGFYTRGLLYLKNQKTESAINNFNKSLSIYDYPKARVARASAYHMAGDISKAINDANYVLGQDKNNVKAHFVLGNCYNDLNKLNEAMFEYNKCIELNKDDAEVYFKRAIIFGKKLDFNSCLQDLMVCLSLDPTYYEAYYWKGVAKVNLKQNPCEDFKIAAQHNFQSAINAMNKYCR